MKIDVLNRCPDFGTYRAARVKSLFNVESGAEFALSAELPIDDADWRIGLVVGPSGSGKTSLGRQLFGEEAFHRPAWPSDLPLIEALAPERDFDDVTAALSAVGLGSVPTWLRPYAVLSNGERFRADLARLVLEAPARAVVDEFSSVVDRQVARVGAFAFQKAWRRNPAGQAVLLSCHADVVDWLEPDWVFETATGKFSGRGLWRRPRFALEIRRTDWRHWPLSEPHHYLKLPRMIAAYPYLGLVEGTPVCHVAVSTRPGLREARACRLVVMPEWQGAGVGVRFLNEVCRLWRTGNNRYRRRMLTLFHTSHPGLAAALRRDRKWTQVSCRLFGADRARSAESIRRAAARKGGTVPTSGYGGHFRAVQGFRYYGEE